LNYGLIPGGKEMLSLRTVCSAQAFGFARDAILDVETTAPAAVHPITIVHGLSPCFRD
jgi:hypothetical protein